MKKDLDDPLKDFEIKFLDKKLMKIIKTISK